MRVPVAVARNECPDRVDDMDKVRNSRAFTVVELLVVVAVIGLLVGILLPAINKAREQSRQTRSASNLRNIAAAVGSYAGAWNDRQLTLVNDQIATYGTNASQAFTQYIMARGNAGEGTWHPAVVLGWGYNDGDRSGAYFLFRYYNSIGQLANHGLCQPIVFDGANGMEHFGSFRIPNCRQFNGYLGQRFYDEVFYAPKDVMVTTAIEHGGVGGANCFDDPGEYCDRPSAGAFGAIPYWSSYCWSPAAMFDPSVMGGANGDTWRDPFSMPAGFRSPAMGQAAYPSLKTQMLEHHWLQNSRSACNPGFAGGSYGPCEPYYFNASWESSPLALFYDGHIETVGTRDAFRADQRMKAQSGHYLWSRSTPWGTDGYFSDLAYDQTQTSFHILTAGGIRGRDLVAD